MVRIFPHLDWIRTECGKILRISPYSVRMQENADQNNSIYGHSLRSVRDLYMYKCSQKLKEAGQFSCFSFPLYYSPQYLFLRAVFKKIMVFRLSCKCVTRYPEFISFYKNLNLKFKFKVQIFFHIRHYSTFRTFQTYGVKISIHEVTRFPIVLGITWNIVTVQIY